MKKILAFVLAVSMALAAGGCSPSGSETNSNTAGVSEAASNVPADSGSSITSDPVTIKFWYTANESNPSDYWGVWQKENVSLFSEKYSNVTIEPTVISDANQYLTKITAEIAAGNAPDVFQTWLFGRLDPFVKAGRIEPLADLLAATPELDAIVPATSREPGTFNGVLYALPGISSGEIIYYNKKIFAENNFKIPETYDELLDIVAKCNEKGIVPMAMGNDSVWLGTVPYMAYFQRKFGNDLYTKVMVNHEALFDSPEFIEVGKELARMVELGMFTPNANAVKPEESQASFKEGRAAMSFDGSWRTTTFYDALGENLGFFNFPDVEGGKGNRTVWLKGYDDGLAISADSKNKDVAKEYFKFMFSVERQKALGEYGYLLATTGIELDPGKVNPFTDELNTALAGTTASFVPWDNLLGANIGAELNKTTQGIIGGKDPAELFKTLNKNAQLEWGS